MKDPTLVYAALLLFLAVVIIAAVLIWATPENDNLETRRIRVAAVTLTGIMTLFVFTSVLYFVQDEKAGKEIFDKAFTAMFTLAGAIIGYLFGSARGGARPSQASGTVGGNPEAPAAGSSPVSSEPQSAAGSGPQAGGR